MVTRGDGEDGLGSPSFFFFYSFFCWTMNTYISGEERGREHQARIIYGIPFSLKSTSNSKVKLTGEREGMMREGEKETEELWLLWCSQKTEPERERGREKKWMLPVAAESEKR